MPEQWDSWRAQYFSPRSTTRLRHGRGSPWWVALRGESDLWGSLLLRVSVLSERDAACPGIDQTETRALQSLNLDEASLQS